MTDQQIPILFYGDSPGMPTGLARIGRDLATAVSRLPQYRVAYLGRGGVADQRLPFPQYTFTPSAQSQWGTELLPEVWQNHARGQRGVIMTIWDPSRLTWFGDPKPMGEEFEELYRFLLSDQFDRWGYFAVDAGGPHLDGSLPNILSHTINGFDRVLAYSRFGSRILTNSLQNLGPLPGAVEWLPHGINNRVFTPRDRDESRQHLAMAAERTIASTQKVVGVVMSNQPRKDFGLWVQMARQIAQARPEVLWWLHTDTLNRYWDLRIMLDDHPEVASRVMITLDRADDTEMSYRYSACDLTVLPSLGEGFGYPIVESMACGVACVHGEYAAGPEWIGHGRLLVRPLSYRLDTRYCLQRPVYRADDWTRVVLDALNASPEAASCVASVEHLGWSKLWPGAWLKWFERGAEEFRQ